LLFISGFAANQAVIAALGNKDDRIVADRLSHASLLEAASLSPAALRRFAHNDATHLATLLAKPIGGEQLVVTEGVFSMDGDSAPLADIARDPTGKRLADGRRCAWHWRMRRRGAR
jgi:8-amino-7-oxononanoate synthase